MADELPDSATVETYVVRLVRLEGEAGAPFAHGVVTRVADGIAHRFRTADELIDALRPETPSRSDQ